jgi:hypothetical protein
VWRAVVVIRSGAGRGGATRGGGSLSNRDVLAVIPV